MRVKRKKPPKHKPQKRRDETRGMGYPSACEVAVMDVLAKGPTYGLAIVDGSPRKLKRTTIYVILQRMEKKGFVTRAPRPKDERRTKPWIMTKTGWQVLRAHRVMLQALSHTAKSLPAG